MERQLEFGCLSALSPQQTNIGQISLFDLRIKTAKPSNHDVAGDDKPVGITLRQFESEFAASASHVHFDKSVVGWNLELPVVVGDYVNHCHYLPMNEAMRRMASSISAIDAA